MKKNKPRLVNYKNGTTVKLDNRQVSIIERGGAFVLEIISFSDEPTKPFAAHKIIRGKLVCTGIALSAEALNAISLAWHSYNRKTKKLNP